MKILIVRIVFKFHLKILVRIVFNFNLKTFIVRIVFNFNLKIVIVRIASRLSSGWAMRARLPRTKRRRRQLPFGLDLPMLLNVRLVW